jgi:hypothetical protein
VGYYFPSASPSAGKLFSAFIVEEIEADDYVLFHFLQKKPHS